MRRGVCIRGCWFPDGSELAECALPHGETISKGCRVREVILVRVVEPLELTTRGGLAFSQEELNRMESAGRSEAEHYLQQRLTGRLQEQGLSVQSELLEGKAAESIAQHTREHRVDLIVIATHGQSGLPLGHIGTKWREWFDLANRMDNKFALNPPLSRGIYSKIEEVDAMKAKKSSKQLLDLLNRAIAREIQVSIQYMWQHVLWSGIKGFAVKDELKSIAISEMKHAEAIAERLNYLGGIPTTKPDPIFVGETLPQMIQQDKKDEEGAIQLYKKIIEVARKEGDEVTNRLFRQILAEEEEHHDTFSTLLEEI